MEPTGSVVVANGLYKQFGADEVLRGIDLCVAPGEIVGILGPSGAGKTTLIKCLIGTLGLNSGSVSIHGVPMPNLGMMDSIGYMAQQDALYDDLTGFQNLVFYGRLGGLTKRAAALYTRIQSPGEIPAWVTGQSYDSGVQVTHNGKTWLSMVDNNVWEPGADGVFDNIWKEAI